MELAQRHGCGLRVDREDALDDDDLTVRRQRIVAVLEQKKGVSRSIMRWNIYLYTPLRHAAQGLLRDTPCDGDKANLSYHFKSKRRGEGLIKSKYIFFVSSPYCINSSYIPVQDIPFIS